MADVKDMALFSSSGPAVSQEIIPLAERISLLYQLSYVCLARFPNLETQVKERALETQHLFSSSNGLLLESIARVDELMPLFHSIKVAAKNNNQLLQRAQALIPNHSRNISEVLERFDLHNKAVAATISEVSKEKSLRTNSRFSAFLKGLSAFIFKSSGSSASTDHLDEVCICLSRVQKDIIELQKFWQQINVLQEYLKAKTFVGTDLVEELKNFNNIFVDQITQAEDGWRKFGDSCKTIQRVFSVQAEDAYKFLTVKPSSLSEEEWDEHYYSAKAEILMKVIMTHSEECLHDKLLLVNTDHLFQSYPVCSSIREYMNQAQQKRDTSVNTVQEILDCINKDIQKLEKQKETLNVQRVLKKSELEKLQEEQASNEQLLDSYRDSLSQANENLNSTQAELCEQEERLKSAKTDTWIGVGITMIPIVGWIAGPGLIADSIVDKREAKKAIKEAKEDVTKLRPKVDHFDNRVSEYKSKISQTKHTIEKVAKELVQIEEQIKELERQRKALTVFLQKIRKVL